MDRKSFKGSDICVVTPTKNRPEKVRNLLASLAAQTNPVGRVIIVATGMPISDIVEEYRKKIPIDYVHSDIGGQILQRRIGIGKVPRNMKLIATVDDDIVFEKDAVAKMLNFCGETAGDFGGVGFNITNMAENRFSKIRKFFYSSAEEPGTVLTSGVTTSICNVTHDLRSQWLNGGATLWKKEILLEKLHARDVNVSWAPFEDLIYSFPSGKRHPLYVCAGARVIHDDIIVSNLKFAENYFRGKMLSLWHCYFVHMNSDLSLRKATIAITFSALGRFVLDILRFDFRHTGEPLGRLRGLVAALATHVMRRDPVKTIERLGKKAT